MRASRAWALLLLAAVGCAEADASMTGKVGSKHKAPKYIAMVGAADSSPVAAFSASFGEPTQVPGDCTGDAALHFALDATGTQTDACNSLALTETGTVSTETAPSGLTSAVVFNNTGEYYINSSSPAADDVGTGDFSIASWVKLSSSSGSTVGLTGNKAGGAAANDGYVAFFQSGAAALLFADGTTQVQRVSACADLRDDSWHHVRWSIDRDSAAGGGYYVDGQECYTSANFTTVSLDADSTSDFCIGGYYTGCTTSQMGAAGGAIADLSLCTGLSCGGGFVTGIEPEIGGTGQTFTRATGSTRNDGTIANGIAQEVISGNPVITQPVADGEAAPASTDAYGVLVENLAYTYRVLHNDDFTNAAWVETGTVATADQATAPNGSTAADLLDDDDAGTAEKTCQTVNATSGWDMFCSIWLKRETGSASPVLEVDGTQFTVTVDSSWRRFHFEDTAASGATVDVCIYPAGTTASNTGGIYAWRASCMDSVNYLEENTAANIASQQEPPTAAAEVTVNADLLEYDVQLGDENTVVGWFWAYDDGGTYLQTDDGANNILLQRWNHRFLTQSLADNADVRSNVGGTPSPQAWEHVAWGWKQSSSEMKIWEDGTEATYSGTPDRSWSAGGTYGIDFEWQSRGAVYSNIAVYDSLLTDAQISTIYTAQSGSGYAHLYDPEAVRLAKIEMAKPDFPKPVWSSKFDRAGVGAAGVLQ